MTIEEEYEDMLDDVYGEIDVCGMKWPASLVFKRIDPIAFRVGLSDYESFREEEE